jgi:plastocyanin
VRRLVAAAVAVAIAGGAASALPSLAASTTKSVAVKDDFFGPRNLTVSKGARVRWVWKGTEKHNVSVASGPSMFRAGARRTGSFGHTFGKRGTYLIVCTIHAPDMQMKVRVR